MTKKIETSFCTAFMLLIMLPLLCVNLKPGGRTAYENRALNKFPDLYDGKGKLNSKYLPNFEKWFDDHIGFRDLMIQIDGVMQYYVADRIQSRRLGPNGELAHINSLNDFQHTNLMSEEELKDLSNSMQIINEYIESTNSQLFFMQCWDKHSIYPEYFPRTINQCGNLSKADQFENYLFDNTNIHVVKLKDVMIEAKANYDVYGKWTDPWHCNPRGSVIAYYEFMKALNCCSLANNYYELYDESNFDIAVKDTGKTYYGIIHKEEFVENFTIKQRTWINLKDMNKYFPRDFISVNNKAKNDATLLVFGDSYIDGLPMCDMLKGTFHKVIFYNINALKENNILPINIKQYKPDLILFELAERGKDYRFTLLKRLGEELKGRSIYYNNRISFAKNNNNSSKYVLYGLSDITNDEGTWTDGNELAILVDLPRKPSAHKIRVKMNLQSTFGRQGLRITVNENEVFSVEKLNEKNIEFSFDNPYTFATIKFYLPNALSMFEKGMGPDTKKLALCIKDIYFEWD